MQQDRCRAGTVAPSGCGLTVPGPRWPWLTVTGTQAGRTSESAAEVRTNFEIAMDTWYCIIIIEVLIMLMLRANFKVATESSCQWLGCFQVLIPGRLGDWVRPGPGNVHHHDDMREAFLKKLHWGNLFWRNLIVIMASGFLPTYDVVRQTYDCYYDIV